MLSGHLLTLINTAFQGSGSSRGTTTIRTVFSWGDANALQFKYTDLENLAAPLGGGNGVWGTSMLPRH